MRFLLLLLLLGPLYTEGYKLLCIFSLPSRSHHHLGQGIVQALLKAGHEVTWVTAYPPKDPPVKGLTVLDGSATLPITAAIDMTDQRNSNGGLSFVREFSKNISRATLGIPALRQALIKEQFDAVVTETFFCDLESGEFSKNISRATLGIPALREALVKEQFDAVLTETFFCDLESGYAAVQQVPWIVLSGVVLQPTVEAMVDDVKSLATVPMLLNDFPIPMNMWQRAFNVFMYASMVVHDWWHQSEIESLYTSLYGPIAAARGIPLPPLSEVKHNVSILFVNSHSSFVPAQSLPPNVVDIGGYHIEETQTPLPKDLQAILDSSPQGVVYFSMGSVIQSSKLPPQTKQDLLKTLGELPYTVLWKFEENLEGLPKNVHIRPWMPQASILAHKNTRVFITHGGLLSTLEALRYGVPLVAVPVFGDQPANAARAVRAGYAQKVVFNPETMAAELKVALTEILSTDKYYKQAKYLSSLFNNRPVAPSKLIAHYVDIAIQSKGAYHLRSKSKEYTWYQRWLLDILAVLVLTLYLTYVIVKKTLCFIVGKCSGGSNSKKTVSHKKSKRN